MRSGRMNTAYANPNAWYKERNEKIYEQHLGHMTNEQIRLYWGIDNNWTITMIIRAEEKRQYGKSTYIS